MARCLGVRMLNRHPFFVRCTRDAAVGDTLCRYCRIDRKAQEYYQKILVPGWDLIPAPPRALRSNEMDSTTAQRVRDAVADVNARAKERAQEQKKERAAPPKEAAEPRAADLSPARRSVLPSRDAARRLLRRSLD